LNIYEHIFSLKYKAEIPLLCIFVLMSLSYQVSVVVLLRGYCHGNHCANLNLRSLQLFSHLSNLN